MRLCVGAGLVSAETVHIDATLIRADVSWESISAEHAEKVLAENSDGGLAERTERTGTFYFFLRSIAPVPFLPMHV